MTNPASINITIDMLKSLKSLVKEFGDTKNTARIIGISHVTLTGYLDGSKKVMSSNVWEYKVSPFLKKDKSEMFKDLSIELTKLRKLEKEIWDLKYENNFLKDQIQHIKDEDEEKIYNLLRSPFNIYFSEFSISGGFYNYPILDDLQKLSKKEEISLISLSAHMNEFRRLYELFRPNSISKNHPYWGTVKIIDAIFETLSRSFGVELDYKFSKYGETYLNSLMRARPINYEINWKSLEEDAIFVSKTINRSILIFAVNNKEYFKNRYIHYYSDFILIYIQTTYTNFNLQEITNAKIEPGKIIMKNKLIEFNNTSQLDRQIYNNCKKK